MSAERFAIIDTSMSPQPVVNVILAQADATGNIMLELDKTYSARRLEALSPVSVGWTWDGRSFTDPTPPRTTAVLSTPAERLSAHFARLGVTAADFKAWLASERG